MSFLSLVCSCLLALVFLVSAASKLRRGHDFRLFADSVRDMALLPGWAVVPVAAVVAGAEAVAPLLLIPLPGRAPTTVGFVLAGLLLTAFTVALLAVVRRGVPTSCRCFGESTAAPVGRTHVVRNLALTGLAGLGGYASLADTTTTGQLVVLAMPLAAAGALVVSRLDDLVALVRPVGAVSPVTGAVPRQRDQRRRTR